MTGIIIQRSKNMTILDFIILGVIFVFVWLGFWSGFIRTLGSIVGLFLGVAIASHYYEKFAIFFKFLLLAGVSQFSAFVVIIIVVSKLTGIVFWFIDKLFKIASIIPFLKTFNRLLGAVLGFTEGILIVGVVLLFATKITIFSGFSEAINASNLAEPLLFIAKIFLPLFPGNLNKLEHEKSFFADKLAEN